MQEEAERKLKRQENAKQYMQRGNSAARRSTSGVGSTTASSAMGAVKTGPEQRNQNLNSDHGTPLTRRSTNLA